ncbi:hypothetical protein [Kitasatospora cineracea]|uniref:Uncharacterized protein n=1 Tax=Kitasatospora cineracea TaxID=88074 RepID=A0A3N4RAE0_9ACTN|nr:hypothetical protein [Kitasatospora cineracea]RPE27935.1 hypothetical protein EDD38_7230 [Kitasatospora cineracea]
MRVPCPHREGLERAAADADGAEEARTVALGVFLAGAGRHRSELKPDQLAALAEHGVQRT